MVGETSVREALRGVIDPELNLDVVELGMVGAIEIADGDVTIGLRLTSGCCPFWDVFTEQVESAVGALDGARRVSVHLDRTAVWRPEAMTDAARQQLKATGMMLPVLQSSGCSARDRDEQLLQIAHATIRRLGAPDQSGSTATM